MTIGIRPICVNCMHLRERSHPEHLHTWGLYCDAYPDPPGIPDAILDTQVDHRTPYAGDHGIRFEAKNAAAADDTQLIIDLVLGDQNTRHAALGELANARDGRDRSSPSSSMVARSPSP